MGPDDNFENCRDICLELSDIITSLKIPRAHIKALSSKRYLCLVNERWLQSLCRGAVCDYKPDQDLDDDHCQEYLSLSLSVLPSDWTRVTVKCVPKSSQPVYRLFDTPLSNTKLNLSAGELLTFISKENGRNIRKSYQTMYSRQFSSQEHQNLQEFDEVFKTFLKRFHPYSLDASCDISGSKVSLPINTQLESICNFTKIYSLLETNKNFLIVQPCLEKSLQDVVNYSPATLTLSHAKTLFIIYQMLHIFHAFHERGLSVGDFRLKHLRIDANLWLHVTLPCQGQIPFPHPQPTDAGFNDRTSVEQDSCSTNDILVINNVDAKLSQSDTNPALLLRRTSAVNSAQLVSDARELLKRLSYSDLVLSDLPCVIEKWANRDITNFKYLMILNHLAGRRLGDPNNHPVLPWIMTFSTADGNYRDFTISKYRINKGDRQLDLTYETMAMVVSDQLEPISQQVPHHVSDVLSDITYYVYKARQTPREILCKYVRSKWVPNEYPTSMQRLQEWTPDECIPEFFTDPGIFTSIHDDLSDLEVPEWCDSPDDFIQKHMQVLESDYVSERLHHWIDLTFGYKLSGEAAVRSKNVYLHLADKHTDIKNHGIVQIFQLPHPQRATFVTSSKKFSVGSIDQNTPVLENNSDINSPFHERLIRLPQDYNPLSSLNQFEAIYKYSSQDVVDKTEQTNNQSKKSGLVCRDLQILGCLIMEMFYAPKLRIFPPNLPLNLRYKKLRELFIEDCHTLPRPLRSGMNRILRLRDKVNIPDRLDFYSPLFHYDIISADGLPPYTPSLLLNMNSDIFPFPLCFQKLYECFCSLRNKDLLIEQCTLSDKTASEKKKLTKVLSREKVFIIEEFLRSHMMKLSREVLDLILPYIEGLLHNPDTCVQAAWHLFSLVAVQLGPQDSRRVFLPHLTRLLSGENSSPKHMKLFYRTFLLQIMTRLGLATFLRNFSTLLVEAVAGYKDFEIRLDNDDLNEHVADIQETKNEIRTIDENLCDEMNEDNEIYDEVESAAEAINDDLDIVNDSEVQFDDEFPDEIFSNGDEFNQAIFDPDRTSQHSGISDSYLFDSHRVRTDSCGQSSLHSISNIIDSTISNLEGEDGEAKDGEYSKNVDDLNEDLTFNETSGVSDEVDTFEREAVENEMTLIEEKPINLGKAIEDLKNSEENAETSLGDLRRSHVSWLKSRSIVRSETDEFKSIFIRHSNQRMSNISDIAQESIRWMSVRLGPLLAARHLSRNLIRMLTLCYYGTEQMDVLPGNDKFNLKSSKLIYGDRNASKVLECLGLLVVVYGERMILSHYVPMIVDMVSLIQKRLTVRTEASLVGCLVLLRHTVYYMTDQSLMDILQDTVIGEILLPLMKLITSKLVSFPSGPHVRSVTCHKMIDVIYTIGLRIGFEMSRKHLTALLLKFFIIFDSLYAGAISTLCSSPVTKEQSSSEESYLNIHLDNATQECRVGTPVSMSTLAKMSPRSSTSLRVKNYSLTPNNFEDKEECCPGIATKESITDELVSVFNQELAYNSYVPFCRIFGTSHIESNLINDEMIRRLSVEHERHLIQRHSQLVAASSGVDEAQSESTMNHESNVSTNENYTSEVTPDLMSCQNYPMNSLLTINPESLQCPDMDCKKNRHLRGNWLAYWEHELGLSERDELFNFKQIQLQTFQGHSGSIRSVCVMDGENSFMSASKDKTVRLWSLRNFSDGSGRTHCQWVYQRHKRSVFSVSFIESLRLVASCDGSLHIWDPFTGNTIHQYEMSRQNSIVCMSPVPAPSASILVGMTDGTLRLLDLRADNYAQELKCPNGSSGWMRNVTISLDQTWAALGYSSGFVSLMDLRSGSFMSVWKGHDAQVLQIKAFNKNTLVTSSFDQSMKVWKVDEGKELCSLKVPPEPIHCFNFYRNQIVSATTSNRIGVHTGVEASASFSGVRVRPDTFKGVITSMSVLPLNRVLLLGADNGTIKLMC